jgi:hypothetical protein
MFCLQVTDEIDVCINIEARVVFKKKGSGALEEEVFRNDTRLRAEHQARGFEAEIAEKVRKRLAEEFS